MLGRDGRIGVKMVLFLPSADIVDGSRHFFSLYK